MIGWVRLEDINGVIIGVHVSHIACFIVPKKGPIRMVMAVPGIEYEIKGTEEGIVKAIGQAYRIGES